MGNNINNLKGKRFFIFLINHLIIQVTLPFLKEPPPVQAKNYVSRMPIRNKEPK